MRDVLGKMRECGKYIKMRDFPHDCGMVDTYVLERAGILREVTWERDRVKAGDTQFMDFVIEHLSAY